MTLTITNFFSLIRERRNRAALELLNATPTLAVARFDETGQFHGVSPLHWAAHRNSTTLCERLIELGADVNLSAGDWWLTPLAWAADAASTDAVELLLRQGADVNQDAIVGNTALHAAAMGGSTQGRGNPEAYRKTAELLIAHGADINRLSAGRTPRTPLAEALANENQAVVDVLRKHGADAGDALV